MPEYKVRVMFAVDVFVEAEDRYAAESLAREKAKEGMPENAGWAGCIVLQEDYAKGANDE